MAFWGIEVKPGSPYTHLSKTSKQRLHISQATLGIGSGTNKSLVQCNVGDKYPVFLCALLPGKTESCGLDLEFEEADDVVFSVIGPRSVHLTGYYLASSSRVGCGGDDESESYGEDIANSENDESDRGSEDDDYEDSFIDDGDEKDQPISIDSDDNEENVVSKPKKKKIQKRLKKKFQTDEAVSTDVSEQKKPVNRRCRASIVDSDDDDDILPLSSLVKEAVKESNVKPPAKVEHQEDNFAASDGKEAIVNVDQETAKERGLKRASPDDTDGKEGPKTKKTKKEQQAEAEQITPSNKEEKMVDEQNMHDSQIQNENGVDQPETTVKKTKKKKNKKQKDNNDASTPPSLGENGNAAPEELKGSLRNPSASQIRTLSSGLIIEELEYGNADGKVACEGKKVKVNYIGKLKNGSVFESNSNDSPFKFRLGAGKVIQGWDIGIEGMRVGGKRRLTIPPTLGYGSKGNGDNIPPDSWLVYEIELVSAR